MRAPSKRRGTAERAKRANDLNARMSDCLPGQGEFRVCTLAARCPVCARPNRCRLETGEAYKGPCWCERPIIAKAALVRLLADLPEVRCLCSSCLEGIAENPEITWTELAARGRELPPTPALDAGDYYREGETIVFTEQYHLRRGYCCGSGCRHCPFGRALSNG